MLLPLAIYLARKTGQRRWVIAALLLAIGTMGTFSRTGIIMLSTVGLVFIWLRPRETIRRWPALLVMLAAVHFVMPNTLGILKTSFFPAGGLVAEQQSEPGRTRVQGRLAKIKPTLNVVKNDPVLGVGFGSQIVFGPRQNALLLDNQWLGTLRETGLAGFFALLWLFVSVIRRASREARADDSHRGFLLVAMTASIAAFGVGMLTFDALGFIQVTFILFALLALTAVVILGGLERPGPVGLADHPLQARRARDRRA
jgi:O-antigen ligase